MLSKREEELFEHMLEDLEQMGAQNAALQKIVDKYQQSGDLTHQIFETENWKRRAEAWRQCACEFASGERDPYHVPISGAYRLREHMKKFDWGPNEMPMSVPASRSWIKEWWSRGERALGQIDSKSDSPGT